MSNYRAKRRKYDNSTFAKLALNALQILRDVGGGGTCTVVMTPFHTSLSRYRFMIYLNPRTEVNQLTVYLGLYTEVIRDYGKCPPLTCIVTGPFSLSGLTHE